MKKSAKRIFAGAMAAAMMLSLTACGGGSSTETTAAATTAAVGTETAAPAGDQEKVVKIAYTSDPGSLGTFDEGSSSGRWTVLAYTYENLIYMGGDGEYYGILAKNWAKNEAESTPTNVVWDIELYDYIKDTAGNNITADDVVFSFNECLENGKGNQHTALTGSLVSIEKTGDYTVKLVCNSEAAGEVENMLTQVMIVSEKAYKDSGDFMRTMPVPTGPYKVESWVTGSSLTLVKNEDYWQKEDLRVECQEQNVDKIEYYFVTESSQIAIGLETGIYDVATSLNYSNASRFMEGGESAANFNVEEARDNYIQQMWINRSTESPLNDLKIAQAVLYAIDQQGLINVVMEGHGEPVYCYGSDLNIGFQEKWKTEDYYNYNPEKAKELLKETIAEEIEKLTTEPALNDDSKYADLKAEELMLQLAIDDDNSDHSEEIAELEIKISANKEERMKLEQELNKFAEIKRIELRVSELEAKQAELSEEKMKLDEASYLMDEFIKAKVNMLEESINARFKLARFKMFNVMLNGNVEECCETTYKGVPYRSMNNAARINVGLDIINALTSYFKVNAPVFIDNAEAVTDFIPVNSQTIKLIVDESEPQLVVKEV